jgi:hypothetical protein
MACGVRQGLTPVGEGARGKEAGQEGTLRPLRRKVAH